jgi:predicted RNase H-like HicB family nuclease
MRQHPQAMVQARGLKLSVVLREEEGGYSVQCLELPGCISEGETREEALANIRAHSQNVRKTVKLYITDAAIRNRFD